MPIGSYTAQPMSERAKSALRAQCDKCANPIMAACLLKLYLDATGRGLKAALTFRKALDSILAYAMPLRSGFDATQLLHIGPKIAQILDRALQTATSANLPSTAATAANSGASTTSASRKPTAAIDEVSPRAITPAKTRDLSQTASSTVPSLGTMEQSLLLVLRGDDPTLLVRDRVWLSGEEIARRIDGDGTLAMPTMPKLIVKGFVKGKERDGTPMYSLTRKGIEKADVVAHLRRSSASDRHMATLPPPRTKGAVIKPYAGALSRRSASTTIAGNGVNETQFAVGSSRNSSTRSRANSSTSTATTTATLTTTAAAPAGAPLTIAAFHGGPPQRRDLSTSVDRQAAVRRFRDLSVSLADSFPFEYIDSVGGPVRLQRQAAQRRWLKHQLDCSGNEESTSTPVNMDMGALLGHLPAVDDVCFYRVRCLAHSEASTLLYDLERQGVYDTGFIPDTLAVSTTSTTHSLAHQVAQSKTHSTALQRTASAPPFIAPSRPLVVPSPVVPSPVTTSAVDIIDLVDDEHDVDDDHTNDDDNDPFVPTVPLDLNDDNDTWSPPQSPSFLPLAERVAQRLAARQKSDKKNELENSDDDDDNDDETQLMCPSETDEPLPNGPSSKLTALKRAPEEILGVAPPVQTSAQLTRTMESVDAAERRPRERETMLAGTYDIVLLLDKTEVTGPGQGDLLMTELSYLGVRMEQRELKVGDFLWIAQERGTAVGRREFVLDMVVERKRMDDLAASIMSGHYDEQKFRLAGSGLAHVICLVEAYGSRGTHSLPLASLYQDMSSVHVQRGFFVKETTSIADTAKYLAGLTQRLERRLAGETLTREVIDVDDRDTLDRDAISWSRNLKARAGSFLLSYADFQRRTERKRNLSVSDHFARQLMCFSGVTPAKAAAIVCAFPTLQHLLAALQRETNRKDRILLLADLPHGDPGCGKTIGTTVASRIYHHYMARHLADEPWGPVGPPPKRSRIK